MLSNIEYKIAGFKEPSYDGKIIGVNDDGSYLGYIQTKDFKKYVSYSLDGKCYYTKVCNTGSLVSRLEDYDLERIDNTSPLTHYVAGTIKDIFKTEDGVVLGCIFFRSNLKVGDTIKILRNEDVINSGIVRSIRRFNDVLDTPPIALECGILFESDNTDFNIEINDMVCEKVPTVYLCGKISNFKIHKNGKMKLKEL